MRHSADDMGPTHDYGNFIPPHDGLDPNEQSNANDIGFIDNMFTRVEDIGQFWLWDAGNFNFQS